MEAWQSFLTERGAQFDSVGVSHFSPHSAYANPDGEITSLCALTHLDHLLVAGPDANRFLQGQVTCNMDEVTPPQPDIPGQFRLGAHCNVKGRMMFNFRTLNTSPDHESDAFSLILEHPLIKVARETLGKYIVFSKAEIINEPQQVLFGVCGPKAAEMLRPHVGSLPDDNMQVSNIDGGYLLRLDSDRFLCYLNSDGAKSLWQRLEPECYAAGYLQWRLADIRAGEGFVHASSVDSFLPQHLNMHLIGGINFKKGCYTGQEIVARMHYRGKLKRHMHRAAATTAVLPEPGSDLYSLDREQSIGNVVSAVAIEPDTIEILAVVTDDGVENDNVYLDRESSQKLSFLPLPYAITN